MQAHVQQLEDAVHHAISYLKSLQNGSNYTSGVVNLVSSFIFQSVLLLSGWIVALSSVVRRRNRTIRTRRRLNRVGSVLYANRHLLVLSGSAFEIKRKDFSTHWRIRDDFIISFPDEHRASMRQLKPDYIFRESLGSPVLDELRRDALTIIPDLEDVILRAREAAAKLTIKRARQSTRVFNGWVFQAYDIVPSVTQDRDEDPTISLTVYRTDYFTLTTLMTAFKYVRERGYVQQQWLDQRMPRTLRLLYTGIGLNVLVVAVDERDGTKQIVLRKRSARAMATVATGQWHVTANEALSETEVEETEILFETWVRRALKEEAGLNSLGQYFIFDMFLVLDDMQPGVSVLAFCTYNHASLQTLMDASKDGLLEYGATKLVPFDDASISKVLYGEPGVEEAGVRTPLSAVTESILRGVAARGVDVILERAGYHNRK